MRAPPASNRPMIGARAFHRHVLDLGDLLGMGLRQRAAEYGEILGEGEHGAAVDGAPAGDDAIAGDFRLVHAEIGRAMLDKHVELFERAFVHQQFEALAGSELAAPMLRFDPPDAAADPGAGASRFEIFPKSSSSRPLRPRRAGKWRRNPTVAPPEHGSNSRAERLFAVLSLFRVKSFSARFD